MRGAWKLAAAMTASGALLCAGCGGDAPNEKTVEVEAPAASDGTNSAAGENYSSAANLTDYEARAPREPRRLEGDKLAGVALPANLTPQQREEHAARADRLAELALSMETRADLDRAAELRRQVLSIRQQLFGEEYYETVYSQADLRLVERMRAQSNERRQQFGQLQQLWKDWEQARGEQQYDNAVSVATQAEQLAGELHGRTSADYAAWLSRLGLSQIESESKQARTTLEAAVAIERGASASEALNLALSCHRLADSLQESDPAKAIELCREAAELALPSRDPIAAAARFREARILREGGQVEEAQAALRISVAAAEASLVVRENAGSRLVLIGAMVERADWSLSEGDLAAAEQQFLAAVRATGSPRRRSGSQSAAVTSCHNLLQAYYKAGRYVDALRIVEALEEYLVDHPFPYPNLTIARLYLQLEDAERAERYLGDGWVAPGGGLPPGHTGDAWFIPIEHAIIRCGSCQLRGELETGVTKLESCLEQYDGRFPPAKPRMQVALAAAYRRRGDPERAMTLLVEADEFGRQHELTTNCALLREMAETHLALGETQEAEAVLQKALAAHEEAGRRLHPDYAGCKLVLAGLLMQASRAPEAEPLLIDALDIYEQSGCGPYPVYARALGIYCDLLRQTGRAARADDLLAEHQARHARPEVQTAAEPAYDYDRR